MATTTGLRFRALGTQVLIASPAVLALADELRSRVTAYERRFSRFLPDSELQQLCEASGHEVVVSAEMFEVLSLAAQYWHETGGIFDPLIRPALEAAGYDRTFADIPATSAVAPPPARLSHVSFGDIRLDARRRTVTLPAEATLDLGGIAKAWILDRLAERLESHGSFLVDIGGDMVTRGRGPDSGPGWLIGVANPTLPQVDLCQLRLRDEAIATSTTAQRRWRQGHRWQHHLIDPRTGAPARSDVSQATVIAPTAVEADIHAKAALILGSEAGLAWVEQRGLAALLVTTRGRMRTPAWQRHEEPAVAC